MRILIVGCGRLGSLLAQMLDKNNHDVTIIDRRADSFMRLGSGFKGTTIVGIGIDEDVLKKAGIEQADAFVAVSDGDNTNVMACQIAKHVFHVPRVMSQIKDPGRQEIYRTLELDNICPTALGVDAFHDALLKGA
jgi:trk system potassium uptake protein TrkA